MHVHRLARTHARTHTNVHKRRYISHQFRTLPGFRLTSLSPRPETLLTFAVAGAAGAASQRMFMHGVSGATSNGQFLRAAGAHVGVGMLLLACLAAILLRTEREMLRGLRAISRSKAD